MPGETYPAHRDKMDHTARLLSYQVLQVLEDHDVGARGPRMAQARGLA